jgi:hypothetical protein
MARKRNFGEIKFDIDKVYADAKGLGGNVYEGSAELGKVVTYFASVIFFIIGILLVYYGIKFWRTPNKYTKSTVLIVTDYTSSGSSGQAGFYSVKGKTKECGDKNVNIINYVTTSAPTIGSTINVYMDPNTECGDVSLTLSINGIAGKIMVSIGIILILFIVVNLYLVRRFKGYAALQGASVGSRALKSIF